MLLIDGGKGQVAAAVRCLHELQVEGVKIVGVAKGPTRKPGLEQLFLSGMASPLYCQPIQPALHLIQQVRDEAHRFAITGHRAAPAKARTTSPLEEIPGVGDKRRQALLEELGRHARSEACGRGRSGAGTGISRSWRARFTTRFTNRTA